MTKPKKKKKPPTQAVIYSRYSPRPRAGESQSCQTQERLCRKAARTRGFAVRSLHRDEARSGADFARPGLEAALSDLKRGDVLLVWRRCRLARDPYLAESIRRRVKELGARIEAVAGEIEGDDKEPHVMLVLRVLDAVHAFERAQSAERTSEAKLTQQQNGRRVGRYPPYGFWLDKEQPGLLRRNEREQRAVARIRELAEEDPDRSPYQIAKVMDEEMPDFCRGGQWSKKTIRKILDR